MTYTTDLSHSVSEQYINTSTIIDNLALYSNAISVGSKGRDDKRHFGIETDQTVFLPLNCIFFCVSYRAQYLQSEEGRASDGTVTCPSQAVQMSSSVDGALLPSDSCWE